MTDVDFHKTDFYFRQSLESLKNHSMKDENKRLCLDFITDCEIGWGNSRKVGKIRLTRVIIGLKQLTEMLESLEEGLMWPSVEKRHIKQLLIQIDNEKGWGGWSIYSVRTILRMFVTWLRSENGYPPGYPGRENLNALLPSLKHPVEVNFACARPNIQKSVEEIVTPEEVQYLIDAWDDYGWGSLGNLIRARNKAFLSIIGEVGVRVGGMGNLQIKNITFDNLGALLTISDKTMHKDPVRVIVSTDYLKAWLAVHPQASEPEAPVWCSLAGRGRGTAMCYQALSRMLRQARDLHNEHAKVNGLPLITRRLHFHAFRYQAQTRDMLAGMPVAVQCMQRGWSPTSRQPQRYARLTTGQADKWLADHYGVSAEAEAAP